MENNAWTVLTTAIWTDPQCNPTSVCHGSIRMEWVVTWWSLPSLNENTVFARLATDRENDLEGLPVGKRAPHESNDGSIARYMPNTSTTLMFIWSGFA
ncbi:hypothetical protein H257_17605 [Aphanomyces astaci]|uniref:Uncharacterized protein n=1 Tax=Aphanomyces astaci TaxID=112090 RepID=W4FG60_APHAT|nr:hypothetical protein H257_17605 [Aphanomyces astaci]ETV65718.1 hypothetical protein H257_17605 [Aphanomyces astaci]|eukprot:XP_009844770.1 hypothetical protein H257_17605 [Aphanomyces astaci]